MKLLSVLLIFMMSNAAFAGPKAAFEKAYDEKYNHEGCHYSQAILKALVDQGQDPSKMECEEDRAEDVFTLYASSPKVACLIKESRKVANTFKATCLNR